MPAPRASWPVLALTLLLPACADTETDTSAIPADTGAAAVAEAAPTSIADIGLQTPESVLYDERADLYLISNINGEPVGRDDNGFISRVRPSGEVEQLKWIDGASESVTLNAPKGMALRGDTLFVADIDSVRAFHRTSGAPLGARGVSGVSSFLNDLAVGPDGTLYVTDTGMDAAFSPTGTDAVHRFTESGSEPIATAPQVTSPNGILVTEGGLIVVGFGGNAVQRFPLNGAGGGPEQVAQLPAGQLDGVVRTSDGSLLVSSWEAQAIFRIAPDGQVSAVVENVEAPADIGYDSRRHRVLIPLFSGNRIEIRDVH
ncbi:MAG TPA: SMP-30/gluconolactonase/LRE family protein [Longimicrobiales bacterium]